MGELIICLSDGGVDVQEEPRKIGSGDQIEDEVLWAQEGSERAVGSPQKAALKSESKREEKSEHTDRHKSHIHESVIEVTPAHILCWVP